MNVSSNLYAGHGANPEVGNVLTDRSSTRIHAPPGGASSFSLAWDAPSPPRNPRGAPGPIAAGMSSRTPVGAGKRFVDPPLASPPGSKGSGKKRPPAPAPVETAAASFSCGYAFGGATRTAAGSNAYANGANQNTGNVLTERSTTRLHAPPGGASSIDLSWDTSPLPAKRPVAPRPDYNRSKIFLV